MATDYCGCNEYGVCGYCDLREEEALAHRETLPPAAPDAEAADFEREVIERGESSARWDRLMALLQERGEP